MSKKNTSKPAAPAQQELPPPAEQAAANEPAAAEQAAPVADTQPGAERKKLDKPTGWPGQKPAVERASGFYSKV